MRISKAHNREITRILEGDISVSEERALQQLLEGCFPNTFDGRTYFKQLPHARFLARQGDLLAGQIGLDLRMARVGDEVVRVLGIIDLCVYEEARRQGLGSRLLNAAEEQAKAWRVQHLILFADRADLYVRNGYSQVTPAEVIWLAIEDRASHSMIRRDMTGTLFAKSLGDVAWPQGDIDLLGYLF